MFSFGGASSAPAFGAATSTPAFGAAPAASAPSLFGASSAPAAGFGAAAPAFGASPFGGGVATPAFGASSSASLFGAASSPSLFGATAASSASLFGAATPAPTSLFGGAASGGALTTFGFQSTAAAAPSLFGGAAQQQQQQQQVTALTTGDGRPITHTSKWDDLSPQTQQYLGELEKVVMQYREDCRQLDADPRLAAGGGARQQQEEMQAQARSLSQSISALGSAVKADVEAVSELREAVLHIVRSTDTALHTFKRSYAWREAAKGGAAFPQDLTGLPVLPSHFLQEAVAGFLSRLRQHQAAVAELEQVLLASSGSGGHLLRRGGGGGGHPADGLQALQGALTNVHDFLIHTAARLQALDDRVAAARDSYLARQRAAGGGGDPFAEEERRQQKRADNQPRSPAAQAAALQAAQQQHGAPQQQLITAGGHTTSTFGASPGQALAVASPGGLFGTAQPSPGGAFGTPLFGQAQQQRSTPTSRKQGSRRR